MIIVDDVERLACVSDGGMNFPTSEVWVLCSIEHEPHYVEVWMDGVKVAGPELLTINSSWIFSIFVPNDGRSHQVWLKDPGNQGTSPYETGKHTVSSDCTGSVKAEVYATNKNAVDIKVNHTGGSGTYTCRLTLDGQMIGAEIQVSPSTPEVTRRILVPPDGKLHLIRGEVRVGSQWSDVPILWYTMSTTEGGGGTGNEPSPTEPATEFHPGETIIVQSTEESTPLATDGSEWVLVEISERDQDNWRPVGPDAGLVQPDEDGNWLFSIETNPVDFPVGSQWDLRARRFRNYQPSEPVIKQFNMVAGSPGGATIAVPVITGPYWDQRSGSWVQLRGTGTPGAVIDFQTELRTPWGRPEPPPSRTTVKANGRWWTWIYAEHWDWWGGPGYKVIAYRARARVHGQTSDWSDWHEVTWITPIR